MTHNPAEAELSILAAALIQPRLTETITLTEAHFYHPARGMLWDAIRALHAQNVHPDPVTLTAHLHLNAGQARQMSDLLVEAATHDHIPANAHHYAAVITDRAERRRLAAILDRLRAQLDDEAIPAQDSIAETSRAIVADTAAEQVVEDAMTLDEFVDQPFGPVDWVVPDLLARDDRLVITGVEGFGKSMIMRQIAVAVACGLHPFSLRSIPARRVLVVDCENPKRIMADKFGAIRAIARRRGTQASDRLWIKRFPGGLDLADPADRLALNHLCATFRPDLLAIGPVYKLYVGGSNQREEDMARTVTSELDKLRAAHGMAVILEHHSPHAQPGVKHRSVRPIGSSLWLRWSEFGWGISPADGTDIPDRVADVRHWRGARDERDWPARLTAGTPDELPWIDPRHLHRATA